MYVLTLDESGTHGAAPVMLVAGIAIHEYDARPLQAALDAVVARHLAPLGHDPHTFELHATEIKSPHGPRPATADRRARPASLWKPISAAVRMPLLEDAYDSLATFQPVDPAFPMTAFAVVIDRAHRQFARREERAYEHVLRHFDDMLGRLNATGTSLQMGLVLHDRHDHEKQIQARAAVWRRSAGRLPHLADVPMFTDSKASRLIQAADLVAYAMFRYYSAGQRDWADTLWPRMAMDGPVMGSALHLSVEFARRRCPCPPCTSRYR